MGGGSGEDEVQVRGRGGRAGDGDGERECIKAAVLQLGRPGSGEKKRCDEEMRGEKESEVSSSSRKSGEGEGSDGHSERFHRLLGLLYMQKK